MAKAKRCGMCGAGPRRAISDRVRRVRFMRASLWCVCFAWTAGAFAWLWWRVPQCANELQEISAGVTALTWLAGVYLFTAAVKGFIENTAPK